MVAAINFTATGVDFGIEADVNTLFDYASYLKFKAGVDVHDHATGYGTAVTRIASCAVSAGNLTFATTSQRLLGDLSNATHASRLLVKTSTANSATNLGVIPDGSSTVAQLVAYNAADASNAGRVLVGVSGTSARFLTAASGTGTEPATIDLGSALGTILSLATATGLSTFNFGVNVASGKNVQVGGAAARATTEPTNAVNVFNGTAPVGTLANGATFYAAAGEMRVMDAGGASTLLSPHDDEGRWVFDSTDTTTGRRLLIDVERLLRFLNDHHGLDFVHEITG
jgi:hypothetical protein